MKLTLKELKSVFLLANFDEFDRAILIDFRNMAFWLLEEVRNDEA